jgi:hypothetical protein
MEPHHFCTRLMSIFYNLIFYDNIVDAKFTGIEIKNKQPPEKIGLTQRLDFDDFAAV